MRSPVIHVSAVQRTVLETIANRSTSPMREVERARIILAMWRGYSNLKIENELGMSREKAKRWRERWLAYESVLAAIESNPADPSMQRHLEGKIRECLWDAPRGGAPPKFSAEQYCQIVGIALDDPGESGRPVSEWTISELRDEAQKRGIVESISRAQVGRFLKRKRVEAP